MNDHIYTSTENSDRAAALMIYTGRTGVMGGMGTPSTIYMTTISPQKVCAYCRSPRSNEVVRCESCGATELLSVQR